MELRNVNPHIFRSNSIRGVFGADLNEELAERIGLAFACHVKAPRVAVADDHRVSSPALKRAFGAGLRRGGCGVVDAGMAPKGAAIFAAVRRGLPLGYVSASHLPAEWNGFKFIHPDGRTFDGRESAALKDAFFSDLRPREEPGADEGGLDWRDAYVAHFRQVIPRAAVPLRLLVDCGNGTAGLVAPRLLRELGFRVTALFPEPDGRMPNRTSDLTPEALKAAGSAMAGHDLGMAFDGDADRVIFLDGSGAMIHPERFALVILRELARTRKGPVVVNPACGNTIAELARRFGFPLRRVPTGAPYMVGEALRHGAVFGMEESAHLIVPSVAPCDDAIAVAAYAASALSRAVAEGLTLDGLLAEAPVRPRKRVVLPIPDAAKQGIMRALETRAVGAGHKPETLDGLRLELETGWALIRASGTEPALRLYAEADTPAALEAIVGEVRRWIEDAMAAIR